MKPTNPILKNLALMLTTIASALLGGCAGNGYISSSVNTVVGLDVSENPKTQVPHVRFGYARSGLYYVPTGKTAGPDGVSGSAAETPDLVSEISIDSKFLNSILITEKFAIGKAATQSNAAATVFATSPAQALAHNLGSNPNSANAAAQASALTEAVKAIPKYSGKKTDGPVDSGPTKHDNYADRVNGAAASLEALSDAKAIEVARAKLGKEFTKGEEAKNAIYEVIMALRSPKNEPALKEWESALR